MESARAVVLIDRLSENGSFTTARTELPGSEISTSCKLKGQSGLSVGLRKPVDDGGGAGQRVPPAGISSRGNHQPQAVTESVTANKMTDTRSLSRNSNSLLRRRRPKRNLSAVAATSAPSAFSFSGKMNSTPSSLLNTRSLDKKMLLKHRQFVQLQSSDREWARSDLHRGCLHVHHRNVPACVRPVLCTLETTAGEIADRLAQLGSKGGTVVKIACRGNPAKDSNGICGVRNGFDQNDRLKSNLLNSRKLADSGDIESVPSGGSLRLLLLSDENHTLQQLDTNIFTEVSQSELKFLNGSSSDINSNRILDAGDGLPGVRHHVTDDPGQNSCSDVDSSPFDEVSSAARLCEQRDSLSDDMFLGTEASILKSPTFDSATEGPDTLDSSSDELELDCPPSSSVTGTVSLTFQRLSDNASSPNKDRLCAAEHRSDVTNASAAGGEIPPVTRTEVPYSSGKNYLSKPCLRENTATRRDPPRTDILKMGPDSEVGDFIPTLYVQLHGDAIRRLGRDEKPLQIQNEFLFKLGFKDPWRVQEEGIGTELGSLIRFYAGKPHSVENSERVQLSGTYLVRKGKLQLPVTRWSRRQVVLCGTCLVVSSVKNSQEGKMHVLPLIGGKVEEVKRHDHCLAFSSSGPQSHTYYVSFDSFTEHLRWQRQASKVVSQRISSVDLSCCSLERVPPNLFYSQDLTHLNLKHNFLLPGRGLTDLHRFSKLRSLNLSNNRLGHFPLAICSAPTLAELNLSCNQLTSVPGDIGAMHSLQTFLLDGNCLQSLRKLLQTFLLDGNCLQSLRKLLQTFLLDGNCLQSLPSELGTLPQLGYLGLSFNQFPELPVVLERLVAMERLCMSGNSLNVLTLRAFRLLKVKHVDLRLNRISSVVPDEPDFLRHVTQLDLRDNQLTELDASVFPKLEILRCDRNRLGSLRVGGGLLKGLHASGNEICQLEVSPVPSNLTYMDISRNRMESLPDWLCESRKLEVLDVSHNQLSELPERLFCSGSLRKLLVTHNQLQRLPETMDHTQIEVLDVQHNQLVELPSCLFLKAESLRCLNASANLLESLPPSSMSEESQSILQELYLTNNRLSDKCVPLLTGHYHLRVLNLAYNQLQSFAASKMAKLEDLEEVDLSGNKLKSIPTTILSCRRMHTLIAHSNCIEVFPEVMQLPEMKCVDLSCNELREIILPENLPPKLQELDLTGNPRLSLDHKTLELLNNIRCFRVDQSPSTLSASEAPGVPMMWSHGYTEASGVKNKLCVAALSVSDFGENRSALYGVFEGDRNVEVPYLLQCTMSDVLAEEIQKSTSQEEYMTNTFLVMQRKLGSAGQKLGGSAVLCHITHDPMDPGGCFHLTTANVGKCQTVLCRDGKAVPLSVLHSVGLEEEYRRIRQHNAIVTEDNKVNGVTDSTRIMGYSFLYPSVIPRPHVRTVTLTARDEFLVLGSRGLWEWLSPTQAVEAVRHVPEPLAAAKKLCSLAQGYGCGGSLSAVVVRLSVTEDCCCCCCCCCCGCGSELSAPAPIGDSSCSEMSSEVSASEVSSEVGSTASSEEPHSSCVPRPLRAAGSFRRQLSGAASDNGLDSEDEQPIAGVFSNGSRLEVEADVHCLLRGRQRSPEGAPCRRRAGMSRGNGSVAPMERCHNLIEVAADAPARKPGGYFTAPAQPDPDDQFIVPPELEEEVKQIMKQHQQELQRPQHPDTPL